MVFYHSVKFHDDPSFVLQLATILVFDFWRCVRAHATSDLDKLWLIGFSCGDLPSCKLSYLSELCTVIDDDFGDQLMRRTS